MNGMSTCAGDFHAANLQAHALVEGEALGEIAEQKGLHNNMPWQGMKTVSCFVRILMMSSSPNHFCCHLACCHVKPWCDAWPQKKSLQRMPWHRQARRACRDAAGAQVGRDKVLRAVHAAELQAVAGQRGARRGHDEHDVRIGQQAPGAGSGRGGVCKLGVRLAVG